MCVRDEVIASPSHYFQAGCCGSLSQVEPVRAAGTRGDKGGSLGCDWSSAARASPGAAHSAGVGSTPLAAGEARPGLQGAAAAQGSPGWVFPARLAVYIECTFRRLFSLSTCLSPARLVNCLMIYYLG